jgi:flagellar biosynthetic protein FliR
VGNVSDTVLAIVLVTLRLGPALAFAPPFSLLRIPVFIRVLFAIGMAVWLVGVRSGTILERIGDSPIVGLLIGELLVGTAFALGLQLTFAAILWAGRVLDIQAGFGLAMVADPTTSAQLPLAGTILAYAAGMIFFTIGGQYDLLALWAASFDILPIGLGGIGPDLDAVAGFMSTMFLLSLGLVGIAMLAIFLADLVIAFLSRTLPQMNVLLLGFQVKSLVMLLTLPLSITFSLTLFLRILRLALTESAGFLGPLR